MAITLDPYPPPRAITIIDLTVPSNIHAPVLATITLHVAADRVAHTNLGKKGDDYVPSSPPDQPPSKRNRTVTKHQDMVDSGQMRVGSSSPTRPSSQVSSRDGVFMADSHDHDSMIREADTERLLTYFVRYILYSIPYEDWSPVNRLECRAPLAAKVTITGGWVIQAEDDGGLRLRSRVANNDRLDVNYLPSRLSYCYHVMFEAKKGFRIIDGQPTISDNWLGQMTAEALVERLGRLDFDSKSQYASLCPSRLDKNRAC
ncbi:hypothetical protein O1611_g1835 [Lasiodiplodia mahajangana]|uniref:Uncharacterized protein n=1 Tax=Lasiodiplodia mahajangana TaxID=1108764 RepID=A0ACC2JWL1_9PEZI|nr:hypothetical protein O1611_g1835 [Lasiodiplodia mahajangana]